MKNRTGAANTVLFLCGLLLMGSGAGCSRKGPSLTISRDVRARSLLVSEVRDAASRTSLLECPIEIINQSGEPGRLQLLSTGCSCYGVSLDGRPLARGETVEVAADRRLLLNINAEPPEEQLEKSYSATLLPVVPGEAAEPVLVQCLLNVYQDVRVKPAVLTIPAPRGEAIQGEQPVTIEHVARGRTDTAPLPGFPDLPSFARLDDLIAEGEPEWVTDDLWRHTWRGTIRYELPADHAELSPRWTFHAVVGNESGKSCNAVAQFVLHTPTPIAYPTRVHFGRIPVGTTRQRRILLTSTDSASFSIRWEEGSGPGTLDLKLADEPLPRHWVELNVTPSEAGNFQQTLTLHTDRSDAEEIRILLEGVAVSDLN